MGNTEKDGKYRDKREILRKMMPGGFLKEDKRVRCSRKRDAKYSTHLSPEPVRK